MDEHTCRIIGIIRSCYRQKFGIPRQAGLTPSASAELQLVRPFARREMIQGLEQFSHLWLLFLFHGVVGDGWQATVRPPRLGGRKRIGVFATRSPHRPNHIGLSAVRLLGIESDGDGVTLALGGVDLLDGTPVLDIKP
ncbi:MAG: tRNA (N6-threonylcarbamoyladenosine(37)-N6)-methyltransferase TrmO, partial [Desulfofustis sp.]|nr:tRNA (N6-threonylcarbamoyladenosine(37)-N6)-methyltransferase TrmO [Desulfofustis sp.]